MYINVCMFIDMLIYIHLHNLMYKFSHLNNEIIILINVKKNWAHRFFYFIKLLLEKSKNSIDVCMISEKTN